MSKALLIKGVAVSVLASFVATTAIAADDHKWKVRVGITNVDPTSNGGDVDKVKSDAAVTFNGVYMVRENIGIELLAATPFEHDIILAGGKVGSTKHLPPTLSAQYYFNNDSRFTPYLGLGINYTRFFSEKTTGILEGTDLKLDASWGLAAQVGVDIDINDNWFVNLDLRKIQIESDWKVNGGEVASGKAKINPIVYGVNIGYKF